MSRKNSTAASICGISAHCGFFTPSLSDRLARGITAIPSPVGFDNAALAIREDIRGDSGGDILGHPFSGQRQSLPGGQGGFALNDDGSFDMVPGIVVSSAKKPAPAAGFGPVVYRMIGRSIRAGDFRQPANAVLHAALDVAVDRIKDRGIIHTGKIAIILEIEIDDIGNSVPCAA